MVQLVFAFRYSPNAAADNPETISQSTGGKSVGLQNAYLECAGV